VSLIRRVIVCDGNCGKGSKGDDGGTHFEVVVGIGYHEEG